MVFRDGFCLRGCKARQGKPYSWLLLDSGSHPIFPDVVALRIQREKCFGVDLY